MIKINLLPQKDFKRTSRIVDTEVSKHTILILLLPILLSIILISAVFAYMEITKSGLKKDLERNRKIISELQRKIEEVKNFEQMNKEIETKNKIIEELRKMQQVPVILLSVIAKKLPDGVWLTRLNYDNRSVSLEGFSFSNLNIVSFVENLKSVSDFQDINLLETQQSEYDKVNVYRFIIKFNLKG